MKLHTFSNKPKNPNYFKELAHVKKVETAKKGFNLVSNEEFLESAEDLHKVRNFKREAPSSKYHNHQTEFRNTSKEDFLHALQRNSIESNLRTRPDDLKRSLEHDHNHNL
jgi:hypothetical protein